MNYRENSLPTTPWRHSLTLGDANCAPVILQQPPPLLTVPKVQLPKQESEEWWDKLAQLPESLGDKMTLTALQWWSTWTKRAPRSLKEIPSGAYTLPPQQCLVFFQRSTLHRAPLINPPLPILKPPPAPLIRARPRKNKAPLESIEEPQSPLPDPTVEDPKELERFYDPKLHEFKLNDIVLLFNDGKSNQPWIGKITTHLGRSATGGPPLFRVTWFDKQGNGSWILQHKESTMSHSWPRNVQLCRLHFDHNMQVPVRLQNLITYVVQRDAYHLIESDDSESE